MKYSFFAPNPEDLLEGGDGRLIGYPAKDDSCTPDHWLKVVEVDITIDLDREGVTAAVLDQLNKQEQILGSEYQNAITEIDRKRQQLLAIGYDDPVELTDEMTGGSPFADEAGQ